MSGRKSRQKGHAFELRIVHELREMGFDAVSSRSESKNLDDKGVDIVDNSPFYFQCKAVERLNGYHEILRGMPADKVRAILHKRNNKGVIVTLYWEDFKELMK